MKSPELVQKDFRSVSTELSGLELHLDDPRVTDSSIRWMKQIRETIDAKEKYRQQQIGES